MNLGIANVVAERQINRVHFKKVSQSKENQRVKDNKDQCKDDRWCRGRAAAKAKNNRFRSTHWLLKSEKKYPISKYVVTTHHRPS